MEIRIPQRSINSLSLSLDRLAYSVSRNTYSGNLTVDVTEVRESSRSVTYRVKIGAGTGGPGARRSPSGRRGPWACWHAFRDVLIAVFEVYPDATVQTALATYRGRDGFERDFPATAKVETRSMGRTTYFAELCDCNEGE